MSDLEIPYPAESIQFPPCIEKISARFVMDLHENLSQRSLPPAQRSLPPAQRSVPLAQRSVPPARRSVPPAQRSLPPAQRSVPLAQRSMPPAQRSAPPGGNSFLIARQGASKEWWTPIRHAHGKPMERENRFSWFPHRPPMDALRTGRNRESGESSESLRREDGYLNHRRPPPRKWAGVRKSRSRVISGLFLRGGGWRKESASRAAVPPHERNEQHSHPRDFRTNR